MLEEDRRGSMIPRTEVIVVSSLVGASTEPQSSAKALSAHVGQLTTISIRSDFLSKPRRHPHTSGIYTHGNIHITEK